MDAERGKPRDVRERGQPCLCPMRGRAWERTRGGVTSAAAATSRQPLPDHSSRAGDEQVPSHRRTHWTGSPRGHLLPRPHLTDPGHVQAAETSKMAQLAQSRNGSSSLSDVVLTPTCEPPVHRGRPSPRTRREGRLLGEREAPPVPWGVGVRHLPWPGARLGAEQGCKPRPLPSSLVSPSRELGLSSLLSTDSGVCGVGSLGAVLTGL